MTALTTRCADKVREGTALDWPAAWQRQLRQQELGAGEVGEAGGPHALAVLASPPPPRQTQHARARIPPLLLPPPAQVFMTINGQPVPLLSQFFHTSPFVRNAELGVGFL